ncbi:calcium-binding protein [Shimia thalassica]|uniref:calcium-binding protein n=1 Tax=Shimia thalassica TaxID=1715693 RepID=UPI002733212A|nr:calcium-binding protein [Shimia thalassica]MDP2518263.1 calcium-binding protein [Shimia thalassica]
MAGYAYTNVYSLENIRLGYSADLLVKTSGHGTGGSIREIPADRQSNFLAVGETLLWDGTSILFFNDDVNVRFAGFAGGSGGIVVTTARDEGSYGSAYLLTPLEFEAGDEVEVYASDRDWFGPAILEAGTTGDDLIFGSTGYDTLSGDAGADTIEGNDGNDSLSGGAGDDSLSGGAGEDTIWGNEGSDTLLGGDDIDTVYGNDGNDRIDGGDGNDSLFGGNGSDTIIGGEGDDTIQAGEDAQDRRDVVYGGAGNDSIDGGYGNDELRGDAGHDTIAGGFGADTVIGGAGEDTLTGSAFADQIFGGAGDDFLNGGFGHDLLNGGDGADRFFHIGISDHGSDWVQDYSAASGDILQFGIATATADQFQINTGHTSTAAGERSGDNMIEEAFVVYRPTGQIMWALVDGAGQTSINLQIGSDVFDLMS